MVVRPSRIAQVLIFLAAAGVSLAITQQGLLPLAPPHYPMWEPDPRPLYHSPTPEAGPSHSDVVDESTGGLEHETTPDIRALNPFGDDVYFNRIYTTAQALRGRHEDGMTRGWTTEWTITGTAMSPGTWGNIQFEDPKGATEDYTPVLKDNVPTGAFNHVYGTHMIVSGVPTKTTGQWESLTWQTGVLDKIVFRPLVGTPNRYRISEIFESNGKQTSFHYDAAHNNRLTEIDDADGKKLLEIEYGTTGLMNDVVSSGGLTVSFGYMTQAGCTCLTVVSAPTSKQGAFPILWQYGYEPVRGAPFLATVATPGPRGGLSVHRNTYDPESGRETMFTDADGNRTTFTYKPGSTEMKVYGPAGG